MKITATKDFGNSKNNKVVLPLVPEPTEAVTKKEDLATVDLYSDPTDTDSTLGCPYILWAGEICMW